MVKVEITIKDEQGKEISPVKSLELELESYHLDDIEMAVDNLKREMLPQIVKELLEKGQKEFTKEKKK